MKITKRTQNRNLEHVANQCDLNLDGDFIGKTNPNSGRRSRVEMPLQRELADACLRGEMGRRRIMGGMTRSRREVGQPWSTQANPKIYFCMRPARTIFCQGARLDAIHGLVPLFTLTTYIKTKYENQHLTSAAATLWRDEPGGAIPILPSQNAETLPASFRCAHFSVPDDISFASNKTVL